MKKPSKPFLDRRRLRRKSISRSLHREKRDEPFLKKASILVRTIPGSLGLIVLLGLLAYANTFEVPFVFDDHSSIVDNPVTKDLGRFLSGEGYRYNPRRFVGYLSFALNYHFGGLEVAGYHAVNLTVHLLAAVLLYALVRLTWRTPLLRENALASRAPWIALAAALLFALHPVQTQAVTYIVQRLASLATMFYLLSLVLYAKARILQENIPPSSARAKGIGIVLLFIGSLLAAVLAMHTKEIAFTLPFVLLLYEFSFFPSKLKKLLFLAPVLLTATIIPLSLIDAEKPLGELLSDADQMTRETETISRADYLLTQFRVIATYLRLLVLPVRQNLDYDYPVYSSIFTPPVLLSLLLLAILLALAVQCYLVIRHGSRATQFRLMGFGILWFFLTLTVESSVIPIRDVIFEHRLYLPSVGFFVALAAGIGSFRYPRQQVAIAGALLVILALGGATYARNGVWHSPVSLWGDAATKSPEKIRPHEYLGVELVKAGEAEQAAHQFRLALRHAPDVPGLLNNLGSALLQQGRPDQAIQPLLKALKSDPSHLNARNNLAIAFGMAGDYRQAAAHLEQVVKRTPDDPAAHFNLGLACRALGRPGDAIRHFHRVAELDPKNAEAFNNLGEIHAESSRWVAAEDFFRQAITLQPENPVYRKNLSAIRQQRLSRSNP